MNDIEKMQEFLKETINNIFSLDNVPIVAFYGFWKHTILYGVFILHLMIEVENDMQVYKLGISFPEFMLEEHSKSLHNKVMPKTKSCYFYKEI